MKNIHHVNSIFIISIIFRGEYNNWTSWLVKKISLWHYNHRTRRWIINNYSSKAKWTLVNELRGILKLLRAAYRYVPAKGQFRLCFYVVVLYFEVRILWCSPQSENFAGRSRSEHCWISTNVHFAYSVGLKMLPEAAFVFATLSSVIGVCVVYKPFVKNLTSERASNSDT